MAINKHKIICRSAHSYDDVDDLKHDGHYDNTDDHCDYEDDGFDYNGYDNDHSDYYNRSDDHGESGISKALLTHYRHLLLLRP